MTTATRTTPGELFLPAFFQSIAVACALTTGWCYLLATIGTASQQVDAYYASIIPSVVGVITVLAAEISRPRPRGRA